MSSQSASLSSEWRINFNWAARLKAAVIAAAFLVVFWELLDFIPAGGLGAIVYRWVHESDWSHGPIIPLFSAYLVYLRWDEIKRTPIRYAWIGLVIMLCGLGLYQYALWGIKIGYVRPVGMMICLLGVIIFLCGLPVLRYTWLPWLYLFFAIPVPKRYYFMLTDPLQRLAATVSCALLELIPGLDLERVGIVIHPTYNGMVHPALSVSDACSGMRSTMVLCALGVAVAFMSWRPWWHRLIMMAACIPIATFGNVIRVSITSWLHIFVDPRYASGTYHTMLGLAIILLATGMFLGIGWVLNNLVVEERAAPVAADSE
ncbi:MAG: exosortase/archaeosortase family protein [Planctomycetota bacterium]